MKSYLQEFHILIKYILFIFYVISFVFISYNFTKLFILFINKIIKPIFIENVETSLAVLAIYIGSIIIVSFIFDLLYFIMVHKIYDNFYNLSPFLTLLTGLYTTFISMFNFPKLFLENHNKEFKKNLPIAMEPWNNHFFVIFLFLVIATFTLNFLKSRQDIKEKEAKKYLIYREIQIEKPKYKYIEKTSYKEGNYNEKIRR